MMSYTTWHPAARRSASLFITPWLLEEIANSSSIQRCSPFSASWMQRGCFYLSSNHCKSRSRRSMSLSISRRSPPARRCRRVKDAIKVIVVQYPGHMPTQSATNNNNTNRDTCFARSKQAIRNPLSRKGLFKH